MPGRIVVMINSVAKVAPPLDAPDEIDLRLQDLRVRYLARSPYEHLLVELATVDAGEAAIAAGAAAVHIDSFADYGIARLRAVSPVPVTGAGEASLAELARVGSPASIVTVWPSSMGFLYDERLAACPGGELVRGVHHFSAEAELDLVGTGAGIKARMGRGEGELVDGLAAACLRACADDATDTVLLGCTCMWSVAGPIADRTGLRVVEPSTVGLSAAFAAAGSTNDRPHDSRRRGPVGALVDAWLAVGSAPTAPDECEVCPIPAVGTSRR